MRYDSRLDPMLVLAVSEARQWLANGLRVARMEARLSNPVGVALALTIIAHEGLLRRKYVRNLRRMLERRM